MNVYCEKVENLYGLSGIEIAKKIGMVNTNSSQSEMNSWMISLPKLISILKKAGLGNLYLVTEFELPAGGRIDAVILGDNSNGNHCALIVELKQWSKSGIEYLDDLGFPYIKVNAKEPYLSRHPVIQTKEYVDALNANHSNIVNGKLQTFGCQYLHDFDCKEKAFFTQKLFSNVNVSNMFCMGEEDSFKEFLKRIFLDSTNAKTAKNLFLQGEYVTTEMDMEIINKITESPENIPLWSDQNKIMDYVRPLLERQAGGTLKTNHLITISGAAGTGKTIVGFRILAEYWKLHPSSDNKIKCKYTLPKNRTIKQVLDGLSADNAGIRPIFLDNIKSKHDVLVIDEAHRITDFDQTGIVINNAQIVFVLQDDRQQVRANEIGILENFKRFALENGFVFTKFKLDYQKRSGVGSYVDRLDKLLYGDEYKNDTGLGIKLIVCDKIKDFESQVNEFYKLSKSTKYYASYCWEWKSKNNPSKMDIVIDDNGYRFQRQWNPMFNQYDWYLDSIDKVGCVYTAQGLGFDYVGFIWWDDLVWRKDHWEFHMDKVTKYDFQLNNSIQNNRNSESLLLNIYRVMLTRAKKGLCIWFKDEETKNHFNRICLMAKK